MNVSVQYILLIWFLRVKFQNNMIKKKNIALHYKKNPHHKVGSFHIGLFLQELPNASQNYTKDMEEIGKKLSDEERTEAYQNSLKWIFTFDNYKGKSNE